MRAEADVAIAAAGGHWKRQSKNSDALDPVSFGDLLANPNCSGEPQSGASGAGPKVARGGADGAGKHPTRHESNGKSERPISEEPPAPIDFLGSASPQCVLQVGAVQASCAAHSPEQEIQPVLFTGRTLSCLPTGIREDIAQLGARPTKHTPVYKGNAVAKQSSIGEVGASDPSLLDTTDAVQSPLAERSGSTTEKAHQTKESAVHSVSESAPQASAASGFPGERGNVGEQVLTHNLRLGEVASSNASQGRVPESTLRSDLAGQIERRILSACASRLPNAQQMRMVIQNGANESVRIAMTVSDGEASIEISATAETARSLESESIALRTKLSDATGLTVGIAVLAQEPDDKLDDHRHAQGDFLRHSENREREAGEKNGGSRAERQQERGAAVPEVASATAGRDSRRRDLLL